MGPGRKPRKEHEAEAEQTSEQRELQWGLGENPGRNELREPVCVHFPPPLQWGLGENPGRNCAEATRAEQRGTGFNGAWAKTQEGTRFEGRERLSALRFNGAWAKTQEGTCTMSTGCAACASCFNGAWAKTQEGTVPVPVNDGRFGRT